MYLVPFTKNMAAVENDTLLSWSSCASGASGASGTGGADVIVMTITDDETGSRYEGEALVSTHCPHGKGKVTYLDGTFHEGEWKNGKRHGKGFTKYSNGNLYEGEWDDNIRTRGTLTYANGNTYKGQFGILFEPTKQYPLPLYQYNLDNKSHPSPPNGYGIYTTATHVMEGLWKNDLAEGYFIITNRSDGTKRSHFFRNNKSIEEGVPLLERYEEGCAICLDDFTSEMGQVVTTCCNHYFHESVSVRQFNVNRIVRYVELLY